MVEGGIESRIINTGMISSPPNEAAINHRLSVPGQDCGPAALASSPHPRPRCTLVDTLPPALHQPLPASFSAIKPAGLAYQVRCIPAVVFPPPSLFSLFYDFDVLQEERILTPLELIVLVSAVFLWCLFSFVVPLLCLNILN